MTTHTQVERPQPVTVLRERLSRIHDSCSSMQPKQAVGEMIAAMLDMPEWAALTAAPQGGAYAELPRVGAIGYASVADIESYVKTLTIGPRLPGVRDVALWSTDQMRAYADATHALRVASHGQAPAVATTYVSVCECHNCGHAGINDDHATDAACNSCGWHGPSPEKDHCPGFGRDGTMTTACPMCSGVYVLVAEAHIPAPTAQPAPAAGAVAGPLIDQEATAYNEWFNGEQGTAYDGMWAFARAAWMARAARTPADSVTAPAAGAVAGPTARKVFLVATGEEHEGEATYTRYDDAPPPLCDSECLYTTAPTPAAQGDALDRVTNFRHEAEGMVRGGEWVRLSDVRAALAQKEGTTHA